MNIRNICAVLLCAFVLPGLASAARAQQPEVKFQCPRNVVYNIEPIEGWLAGTSSRLDLPFSDINTDKNQVDCNYERRYGNGMTSATLTAYAPKGYRCQVPGNKGFFAGCKPAVPPIKKKPNN